MKGSGLANTCPVIEEGTTNLGEIPSGNYSFDKFCLEPTSFKASRKPSPLGKGLTPPPDRDAPLTGGNDPESGHYSSK